MERAGAVLVDPLEIDGLNALMEAATFCPCFRYDMWTYLASLGEDAALHDVIEVLDSGQYSPYIEDRLRRYAETPLDVAPEDWDEPCPPYLEHPGRRAFLDAVVATMDGADVEALVYPTWTQPPAHLDRAIEEYGGDNSQLIAPATGMPAATVPMGVSHGSLPAGLQILGRPWAEGALFRIAYAYEQATHRRRSPALFPELEMQSP